MDTYSDKVRASQWAKDVLADPDAVILDTETTGFGEGDVIIEIAILSVDIRELINTVTRPPFPIPPEASGVHGIIDAEVEHAVTWPELWPKVRNILDHASQIIIWNADYDMRMIAQTNDAWGIEWTRVTPATCAMHQHARWFGDWSDYHKSYKWQRLDGGHRAAGDCRAVIERLQEMSKWSPSSD